MADEKQVGRKSANGSHISLFVELKRQLSIAQVILGVKRDRQDDCVCISVMKSGMELTLNTEVTKISFQDLTFVPLSCHGLQWDSNEELQFRMQVSDFHNEVIQLAGSNMSSSQPLDVFECPDFSCRCRLCGQAIIEKENFKRVLPLPSDNWREMADTWFCHEHVGHINHRPVQLAPRQGDCLVGCLYFMVHDLSLSKINIVNDNNCIEIKCGRCHGSIGQKFITNGEKTSASVENQIYSGTLGNILYLHALELQSKGPVENEAVQSSNNDISKHKESSRNVVEQTLSRYLLLQAHHHHSFRLLVETRSNSGQIAPFLLLWVLDSQTLIFSARIPQSTKHIKVEPKSIVKVLYRDCTGGRNKGLGEQWKKDMTVHSTEMPYGLCLELLHILTESTKSQPVSMHILNGFYVGFLQR